MRFQQLLSMALACGLAASAMAQPVVDGYVRDPVTGVVEPGYAVSGITYTMDQGSGQFAGILYSAEDASNFYFAFEQSVYYNDNTYDVNAIDWSHRRQGHRLRDLLNSEHAEIQMFDCSGSLVLDFFLDYATQDRATGDVYCLGVNGGDGTMITGSASSVTGWGSSLEWDWNYASPLYPSLATTNPQRVPTNTYDPGTTADPNFPWVYPLVYEWSVDRAAFPGGCFGSLSIQEVHNSPLKNGTINPNPTPVLNLRKYSDPPSGTSVSVGQVITYSVEITNVGTMPLTDVLITDLVDPNLDSIVPLDGGSYDAMTRIISWPVISVLDVGQSVTVRFQATAAPTDPSQAQIFNFATVISPDLPTPAETNTTEHDISPDPDLSIAKDCPVDMTSGGQAVYTLTIDNNGLGAANDVQVIDTLPPEVSFFSANPAPTSVGTSTLTWDLGSMAALTTTVIQITVDVVAASGNPQNSVTVTTTSTEGGQGTADNSDQCQSTIQAPDVQITKNCPADMIAGTQASYTLTIENLGTAVAENVVVTDTLPAEVSYASANPAPTSTTPLSWDLGNLAAGAVVVISIDVNVVATSGTALNLVSVTTTSAEGGQGTANNDDQCNSNILAPDVQVTKNCPTDMVAGTQSAYTITVENVGTSAANAVVVTDNLPSQVSYVGATPTPTSTSPLSWDLGTLAAGDTVVITVDVSVVALAGIAVNNVAVTTTSTEGGQGAANNSDQCQSDITAPDVEVSKNCPVDMVAGTGAQYTITVRNIGSAIANSVVVTETLPAEVSYVSASPSPTSTSPLSWDLGNMAIGQVVVITLDVNVDATAGTAVNVVAATTTSQEGGAGAANNSDTCQSNILAPDVAISKQCPVDMIAGTQSSYTITVQNVGNAAANGVVVSDTLPAEVTFVSASPAPTGGTATVPEWSLGSLAAGASVQITVDVNVAATSGTAVNTVDVTTTSTEGGQGAANNSDTCQSNVLAPDVAVTKQCPVDMIAGTQSSYTITVQNVGTATANDVVVTDTLPAEVSYVGANPAPTSTSPLSWSLGSLAAGASVQITVDVNVTGTSGTATNTVDVTTTSTEGGQGAANNSDTCQSNILAPDVAVTKQCPVDMVAGTQSSYTITVQNVGTATADNVVVSDTLPAEVTFISANPAPTGGTATVPEWSLGSLAAGASVQITVDVNVDATSGTATNTVDVTTTSTEGGQGAANNSDTCQSNILSADVAVTAICSPGSTVVSDTYAFVVDFCNNGTASADNAQLVDTVPAGFFAGDSYTAVSTIGTAQINGLTVTVPLGTLAPGQCGTLTISGTVTGSSSTAGIYQNSATITTTSVQSSTANDTDSCQVTVQAPDLTLDKQSQVTPITTALVNSGSVGAAEITETASDSTNDSVTIASRVTYTLTVTNNGDAAATGVTLTDTLPAGVNVTANPDGGSIGAGGVVTWNLGAIAAGANRVVSITVETTYP